MLALKFRTRDTSCLVNFQALKWARLLGVGVGGKRQPIPRELRPNKKPGVVPPISLEPDW